MIKRLGLIDKATGMVGEVVEILSARDIQCPTCYSAVAYCTCKAPEFIMCSTCYEALDECTCGVQYDKNGRVTFRPERKVA